MRQWFCAFCTGLSLLGLAGCGGTGGQTSLPVSQAAPVGEVTRPVAPTPSRATDSQNQIARYTPGRDPFEPLVVASATASATLPGSSAPLVPASGRSWSTQQPADPVLRTVNVENGVKRAEIVNGGQYYEKTEGDGFDGYLVQHIDPAGTVTVVKDGLAQVLKMIPSLK